MSDRYAVFGNPISHSKSPEIHHLFAEQTNQDIVYDKQCIELDQFEKAVLAFFDNGGCGLNVTVPFKVSAYEMAETLTTRAEQAQAVNTFYIESGRLVGDNTDGIGLCNDLTKNLNISLKGKKLLILGAGGAVRGILGPLALFEPESVLLSNRTYEKAKDLQGFFQNFYSEKNIAIESSEFKNIEGDFDLIINGTSASMGGGLPDIDKMLVNGSFCYDMMYAKELTPFLSWVMQNGAAGIADGLGMLVEQAAEAFRIWRGINPVTKEVMIKIKEN